MIDTDLGQEFPRVSRELESLKRATAIQDELTRLVLQERPVQEIVVRLNGLLERPVALEDSGCRLLAAVPEARFLPFQPGEQGPVGRVGAAACRASREAAAMESDLRPRRMPAVPAADLPSPWLVAPVAGGARVLGYLTLLEPRPGDFDLAVLERAASILALAMLRLSAVAEAESRILGDLFDSLIHGEFRGEGLLDRRLRNLGLDPDSPYRTVVIELEESGGPEAGSAEQELADRCRAILAEVAPGSNASVNGGQVVLLVREPKGGGTEHLTALWRRLNEVSARPLRGGVGPVCRSPREYVSSFARAREMLAIQQVFGHIDQMAYDEDLGPYAALLRPEAKADLVAWARRRLGRVLEYDSKRGGELLDTMQVYLRTDCSPMATAQAMHLHISGVKYRLARIEELLGADLNRSKTRFELHLALLAARLERLG